jgi:hypothetical protein
MIYATGTVTTSAASPVVTGSGTAWSTRVRTGQVMRIDGSVAHHIAAIISDTELRLTEDFSGGVKSGALYEVADDFTSEYSISYPAAIDVQKASIMNRSVNKVETLLAGLDARVTALEP